MPTDDERREVARRLRHAWVNVPDRDPVRHHLRVLNEIYEAVGISDGEADAIDLFNRLADLIEPSCDRDALLALADEMERRADLPSLTVAGQDLVFSEFLVGYARRVRKACGEGA